ncbi:MAG: anthranilate synthase [Chloroflexi bacterium]|jgi:anthranilate synthase/aminodeoxychorismate synthase-like glutamine amidotransferase|nr:MAG: anthranilate synthase [Chloroflexota bacterium]
MSIFLLDNYDSFTYNLYQYLCELGAEVTVARNDQISLDEVAAMEPERIVVSPGPKRPEDAGISVELIRRFAGQVPILGVCLGHQCIGAAFGADVVGAGEIMHGKSSPIEHDGQGVYAGLPQPIEAIRYHSLAIDPKTLPVELVATSWSDSGVLMGVRHREYALEGVQFHPESIKTEVGHDLLSNFLSMEEGVPA